MAIAPQSNRALILDFGGVVTRTLFETHDLTERALGLAPGTLRWLGPFDSTTDPLWVRMQAQEITERDYWMARTREVGALVGENWTSMMEFVQQARGAEPELVLRREAKAAILAAKAAGVRLAILSNELDLFYGEAFRKTFPLIDLFEVIVDATYNGILKPDPRSYQACLTALNLPASACVFVDDQLKNVNGALAIGLPAVHFDVTGPAASYAKALAMLGVFAKDQDHA